MKKKLFTGIDISKNWLDAALCLEGSLDIVDSFRVDNTLEGIEKLIKKIEKKGVKKDLWVCFEHTGNYGLLLAQTLEIHELKYSAVSALEIKQSIGITRGKTDVVDAARIAQYALTHKLKLKESKLPATNILKIKTLLTYRGQLLKISQQLQNSLKSHLISLKSIDIQFIIDEIEAKIKAIKENIKSLERQIEEEINSNELLSSNYNKIKTVKGIGLLIACYTLVYTNNFNSFENPRKFNCYAGLAPFEHSSGSSIKGKTKTSSLRNKNMKRLLFNGANTAVMYDLELKAYYNRKKNEGKNHMTIINAIACKLVYRMFAVQKRNEPYVNLVR